MRGRWYGDVGTRLGILSLLVVAAAGCSGKAGRPGADASIATGGTAGADAASAADAPFMDARPHDPGPPPPWNWGPLQKDACVGEGKRQVSATLHNIPAGADPAATCQAAPRNVVGIDFDRPDRCVTADDEARGEWDVPDTSCLSVPPGAPVRGGDGTLRSTAPLEGYADLHVHQMGHLGFGGTVLWGAAFGPPAEALTPIPAAMKAGHDRSEALFDGDIVGGLLNVASHDEDGYPGFTSWPNRGIATHQQAYDDWLYRAYVGGLRLMVMLAVNSEDMFGRAENDLSVLGRVAIQTVRAPGRSTNDMEALEWQVREAYRMQALVDARSGGPGKGWYRIVRDPDEAAAAIAAGRLAVVLGTELQHLFNCDSDRPACSAEAVAEGLDRLEGMGVNYVFPVHHKVNQFGGPAQFNPLTNGPTYDCKETNEACSSLGLTDTGRTLVRELMARGMLIDTEHMSWKAFGDTLDMVEPFNYPVMASHIHAFDMVLGPKSEYDRKTEQWRRIFDTGGMVGMILGGAADEFAPTPTSPVRVPISCGGADKWANTYLYAQSLAGNGGLSGPGGRITLGSDWNGFSGWPSPRFGSEPCTPREAKNGQPIPKPAPVRYPIALPSGLVPAAVGGATKLERFDWVHPWDYNDIGLNHVALMPDFVEDLRLVGLTLADLEAFYRSARGFVEVWRAARDRQGPSDRHRLRWVPRSPFDVLAFEYRDGSRDVTADGTSPICRTRTSHRLGFEKAGACVAVDAAGPPPAAGARTLPPVGIAAYHAGRCLDVPVGSTIDGAAVRQWTCNASDSQQWQLRSDDGRRWALVNMSTSKCLDVSGESAVQQTCAAGAGQGWEPVRTGNTFALRSPDGSCLEVDNQSRDDGAAVVLVACSGASNQQWEIPSLRGEDYELLYQADKGRIAWLTAADAAHPIAVTVDGTRSLCRATDASHWIGTVSAGQCVGKTYAGVSATAASYQTLFQAQ